MPFYLPKSTFFHVPKTGGTWVEVALSHAKIPVTKLPGDRHAIGAIHGTPFTFVRDPADWLESLFHHRKMNNWNWQDRELENLCKDNNLSRFVEKVCEHPGIITRYYELFIGGIDNLMVGRTAYLKDNLISILQEIGEEFDEKEIRYLKPINEAHGKRENMSDKLRARVEDSQKDFIEKYI